ncbi:MAG: restriction endonuclease, partial [Neisseriaceae bacterium]|nr:restriction endonuclease [Neisseriaceae bacterium]
MERERLEESNRLEKAKREQERLEKERLGTLTNQDKLQEKLDNYLYQLSDNLAIGRAYERYIGYLYEKDHWQVTFNGCIKGNEDNGIDLICQKGNEVHLIQAKNWNKKIFNKVVHQLYGSMAEYRLNTNNPQLNIIG